MRAESDRSVLMEYAEECYIDPAEPDICPACFAWVKLGNIKEHGDAVLDGADRRIS